MSEKGLEPRAELPSSAAAETTGEISEPDLHQAFEERELEAVLPMAALLALGFLFYLPYNLFVLAAPASAAVLVFDSVVLLSTLTVLFLAWSKRLSRASARWVLILLALTTQANILHAMAQVGDLTYTNYVLILVVVSGFVALRTGYLAVLTMVHILAWAVVAWHLEPGAPFWRHGAQLIGAAMAAGGIHAVRLRMVHRILVLRALDAQRGVVLAETLARAEHELAERRAAEEKQRLEQQRRSELEQQLRQAQKLEAIGTLAGGVAHDINNVLTAVMSIASLLERSLGDTGQGEARDDVRDILGACRRGRDLTRNLLGFARQGQQQRRRFDVNEVISEVLELLARTTPPKIAIARDLAPGLPAVDGDPSQINQALLNIALNAIDALEGRGKLVVRSALVEIDDGDDALPAGRYVSVSVSDDGVGMSEETRVQVFEPFFTTKPAHLGTGLGLSMVYGAAQQHGGRVLVESALGEGTTLTLQLPALASGPIAVRKRVPTRPAAKRLTVLVVDDEPMVRSSTQRVLRQLGHGAILAEDGQQALEALEQHHETVDAVLLDLMMPVMDGRECFAVLRKRYPQLPVIFCSGYAKDSVEIPEVAAKKGEHYTFLPKPWAPQELAESLANVIRIG